MILGAIEAAEAAGRAAEITFVGFDAVDDAVAAVDAGQLAATIAQQPAEMGRLGVETAFKHLEGESVADYIPVDLRLVAGEAAAPPAEGYTLGLSLSTLNNPFFVTLKEGAEEAAAAAGVELIVVDAQDDSAKEATNIEDLIQKEVDALLINPTDADAIVPSVQKANEAGIPVFTVDRSAAGGEIVSHIASDNVAGGRMAGKFLCDLLGGSGKAVELEGIAGTSAARDRGQGFNEVMSSECADVEIVARQTANFNRAEGLSVFENILQAQPEIDGVFAHNDEMILGAIEAAEAAGRAAEISFVGFDAVDDAVAAVEAGQLAATVAQQPAEMGRLGVEFAVKYLNGVSIDTYVPVDLRLVTP
jgi:ribose transport system substrate-binding protein